MKNVRWILFAVAAMMAWGACSEDTFTPPMIGGGTSANEVLISLDTASTFTIERTITSEKGLQSIVLRDMATDKVIDEETTFANPSQYTYKYDYELPKVEELTVVHLSLEVSDGKEVVKHSFTLTIRPESMLNVEFAEEGNLIATAETLDVTLFVTKGAAALKTLNLELDGVALDPVDISEYTKNGKHEVIVTVNGLTKIQSYTLKVTVEDEWGVSEPIEKTIIRKDPVTWKDVYGVSCGEGELMKFAFQLNSCNLDYEYQLPGEDKLYRFCIAAGINDPLEIYCDFTYDDQNRVSEMKVSYWALNQEMYMPMEMGKQVYTYQYDAAGKVTGVMLDGTKTFASDIVYEGNRIVSFTDRYKDKVEVPYVEHEGETVSTLMSWDEGVYNTYTYSKLENPFYMPELPPFVYMNMADIFSSNFDMMMRFMDAIEYMQKWSFSRLFYNKYLVDTTVLNGEVQDSFTNSGITASPTEEGMREQKITYVAEGEEVITTIYYN